MPWHLRGERTISLAEALKLFGPGRERRGDVRESRRGLLEYLALQVGDAPSPFGDTIGGEGQEIH
jgi:hypothetical protein